MSFDLSHAPKLERTAEPPKKKKEKAPAAAPTAEATASTPSSEPKTQKKEKKKDAATPTQDAGKKKGGKAVAAPAADEGEPVPSMIDLRVGHIIDGEFPPSFLFTCSHALTVKKHPDADGLYIEVLVALLARRGILNTKYSLAN